METRFVPMRRAFAKEDGSDGYGPSLNGTLTDARVVDGVDIRFRKRKAKQK